MGERNAHVSKISPGIIFTRPAKDEFPALFGPGCRRMTEGPPSSASAPPMKWQAPPPQ